MGGARIWSLVGVTAVIVAALAVPPTSEGHHLVLPFNLEEMVVTADRVFIGRCVAANATTEGMARGVLPVTHYTFDVEQVVKGQVPASFTFTQLGHPPGVLAKRRDLTLILHGMTDYDIGQRVLLFLIPNYLGGRLTYPVGLTQGMFVLTDDGGGTWALNGVGNTGLFRTRYTGDYTPTGMPASQARVIRPALEDPLAGAVVSPTARALKDASGAMPLTALLELVDHIHAEHGGARGSITRAGNGAQP